MGHLDGPVVAAEPLAGPFHHDLDADPRAIRDAHGGVERRLQAATRGT